MLRVRYPYEFKTIEEYAPGKKVGSEEESHLKKLVEIDGRLRQLYYYPHRNKDGLIYREEQIYRKTIEKYKNRKDKLIYRSVSFDPYKAVDGKDMFFKEVHKKVDVVIKKMTQKYELDKTRPPEGQYRKIVVNYDTKELSEYFHYCDNSVKEIVKVQSIEKLRSTETNEKDAERSGAEQKKQILNRIIKDCISEIISQEGSALKEMTEVNTGDIFEKSIYDKARDRVMILFAHYIQARREKKQQEEEGGKEEEDDYLAPVLAKLQLDEEFKGFQKGIPLTVEQAKRIQNEAFQMHKERIKARAKIIQDRLDKEVKEIERQFVKFVIWLLEQVETTNHPEKLNSEQKELYNKEYTEAALRINVYLVCIFLDFD